MVLRVNFKTPPKFDDSLDLKDNLTTPFTDYMNTQDWKNSSFQLRSLIGGNLPLKLKSLINTSGPIDNSEVAQKLAVRLKTATNAFDPIDVLTQQQNLQWRLKTSTNPLGSSNTEALQQQLSVKLKGSNNYFNPQDNPANSQPSLEYKLKTVTMNGTSNANTMLVTSVGQSANNLLGKVNSIAKTTIDPNGLLNTTQNLALNRGIVGQAQRLVNNPQFLQGMAVLSSNAPLQITEEHRQTLLATGNQAIRTAKELAETGNVHENATTEIERTDSEREMGNRIIGNKLQEGRNFVENAMRDGHTTLAGIKGIAKETGMGAYLPTDEVINKKLGTYNIQTQSLTKKDIEEGMYGGMTRVVREREQAVGGGGKLISAGLLGLGIGKLGEYGATIGRSTVQEYASFMKNTIGTDYDFGSPYANVIQQQSTRRQATIGLVASAIGVGIGSIGGPPGMFVGGTIGSQIGSVASSIGGAKDTLQAQAHAEYIQQAMMMQTLINARPDVRSILGGYGNITGETGKANILDLKTPTRMMIARGAITVNNDLTKKFIDSTTDEAIASNLSLSQSEDYGYNKALISRYPGGSKLDLGGMAKNADISVGDLAQRTLDYVPFTRGNIQSASEFAQKSFSQSSGYTARQLSAGTEGYLSVWQKDMIARQFEHESYFDLINNKNGSLTKLGARASKLGPNADPTALAETNFLGIGPGDMQYVPPKRISKNVSPLFPAMSVESFMQTENPIRMNMYHGKQSQEDVNKSLQEFEGALSNSTVQLRTWTDTVSDYMKFVNPDMPKFPNVGPTGSQ